MNPPCDQASGLHKQQLSVEYIWIYIPTGVNNIVFFKLSSPFWKIIKYCKKFGENYSISKKVQIWEWQKINFFEFRTEWLAPSTTVACSVWSWSDKNVEFYPLKNNREKHLYVCTQKIFLLQKTLMVSSLQGCLLYMDECPPKTYKL